MKTGTFRIASFASRPPAGFASRRAFSLLELLVGMAILTILGVFIVQLIGATTRASRLSNAGIDAAAQARLAFDRIGMDLAALVQRDDVDFIATNPFGTGSPYPLLFLSEVTSAGIVPANNRGVSLVGYQINTTADTAKPCLLRGSVPFAWTGANSQSVTGYQTNGLPVSLNSLAVTLNAQDFDVLASAVIRVVMGFQLYPDGENVDLIGGATVKARGQIVYTPPVRRDASGNPSAQIDKSRISSLIVGFVAIDPEAFKLIDSTQTTALAVCFPTPADGELPVGKWTPIAENVNALPAGVPLPARQSLRIFQRAFPITPFGANAP